MTTKQTSRRKKSEVATGGADPSVYEVPRGTRLYHGTDAPSFTKLRGPIAWLTPDLDTAIHYGGVMAEKSGHSIRIIEFATTKRVRLAAHSWVPTLYDYAAQLEGKKGYREWDPDFFAARAERPGLSPTRYNAERTAQILCASGLDGYWWGSHKYGAEVAICNPEKLLRYIGDQGSVVPAAQ